MTESLDRLLATDESAVDPVVTSNSAVSSSTPLQQVHVEAIGLSSTLVISIVASGARERVLGTCVRPGVMPGVMPGVANSRTVSRWRGERVAGP